MQPDSPAHVSLPDFSLENIFWAHIQITDKSEKEAEFSDNVVAHCLRVFTCEKKAKAFLFYLQEGLGGKKTLLYSYKIYSTAYNMQLVTLI